MINIVLGNPYSCNNCGINNREFNASSNNDECLSSTFYLHQNGTNKKIAKQELEGNIYVRTPCHRLHD